MRIENDIDAKVRRRIGSCLDPWHNLRQAQYIGTKHLYICSIRREGNQIAMLYPILLFFNYSSLIKMKNCHQVLMNGPVSLPVRYRTSEPAAGSNPLARYDEGV